MIVFRGVSNALHQELSQTIGSSEFLPRKQETNRRLNPWTAEEFVTWTWWKKDLFKNMKKYPGNALIKEDYNKVCNKVNSLKRDLKAKYLETRIEGNINKSNLCRLSLGLTCKGKVTAVARGRATARAQGCSTL